MRKDPIVEEIHLVREKIARECNYDLRQIMKHLREREKQHAGRIVYKKVWTKQRKAIG